MFHINIGFGANNPASAELYIAYLAKQWVTGDVYENLKKWFVFFSGIEALICLAGFDKYAVFLCEAAENVYSCAGSEY